MKKLNSSRDAVQKSNNSTTTNENPKIWMNMKFIKI